MTLSCDSDAWTELESTFIVYYSPAATTIYTAQRYCHCSHFIVVLLKFLPPSLSAILSILDLLLLVVCDPSIQSPPMNLLLSHFASTRLDAAIMLTPYAGSQM